MKLLFFILILTSFFRAKLKFQMVFMKWMGGEYFSAVKPIKDITIPFTLSCQIQYEELKSMN